MLRLPPAGRSAIKIGLWLWAMIPVAMAASCMWALFVQAHVVTAPRYERTGGLVESVSTIHRARSLRREITYSYTVHGQRFVGSRIALWGDASLFTDEQKTFTEKYVLGAAIDVYYRIDDPSRSVLLNRMPPGTQWYYGLTLGMCVIVGGAFCWLAWTVKRASLAPA